MDDEEIKEQLWNKIKEARNIAEEYDDPRIEGTLDIILGYMNADARIRKMENLISKNTLTFSKNRYNEKTINKRIDI